PTPSLLCRPDDNGLFAGKSSTQMVDCTEATKVCQGPFPWVLGTNQPGSPTAALVPAPTSPGTQRARCASQPPRWRKQVRFPNKGTNIVPYFNLFIALYIVIMLVFPTYSIFKREQFYTRRRRG